MIELLSKKMRRNAPLIIELKIRVVACKMAQRGEHRPQPLTCRIQILKFYSTLKSFFVKEKTKMVLSAILEPCHPRW